MTNADGRVGRWSAALRRTPVAVWDDDVTDWAAALTYYAVLALFPVLLVILSIVGLTIPTARPEVIDRLSQAAPVESRACCAAPCGRCPNSRQRHGRWSFSAEREACGRDPAI